MNNTFDLANRHHKLNIVCHKNHKEVLSTTFYNISFVKVAPQPPVHPLDHGTGKTVIVVPIYTVASTEILSKWANDFNKNAEGLVKVSKADLVNYLITNHAKKIAQEESREIAARYYDETRWLSWSVAKMKEAKKNGVRLLFEDLMKFRDEFIGKSTVLNKKKAATASTKELTKSNKEE